MKILLVEDDATLRECLRLQLEVLGHEVWEAGTVVESTNLILEKGHADAAIVDGYIPYDEGFLPEPDGLLIVSSRIRSGRPAVLYTGDEALLDEARCLGLPVVRKPGKIGEILAMLSAPAAESR